ncbi:MULTISPECIES: hypothetical protein [unclassified Thiocapsa]|uniref:hypothetical protein n=1 Tax=unclassified Thiocapsa TaxID=2641286 RepID=UPI0035B3F1EF
MTARFLIFTSLALLIFAGRTHASELSTNKRLIQGSWYCPPTKDLYHRFDFSPDGNFMWLSFAPTKRNNRIWSPSFTEPEPYLFRSPRTYSLNLYGRVRDVVAAEQVVMLKTLRCQVRVVWVYRRTQWIALVTTDLTLSVEQIIEIYGARWKIEAGFSAERRGQVLTCDFPDLPLRLWPDRCDSSLPVRSTTSPRAVTDGRTFFGPSVTGGCFSMCSRAYGDGLTGSSTPTA